MVQGNTLVKELRTVDDSPAQVPAVLPESGTSMFERLARDQNVDVDKLERLMAMWERTEARTSQAAFNAAMSAAQKAMRPVAADAENSQTHSRYASYGALDRALRPVYTEHGFALSFDTGDSPLADHVRVVCYVSHSGGHSHEYHVDMPADGKGAKGGDVMTKTHAAGSAMSYGQRYLLKLIFNVAVGEDDDGNKAGQTKEIPPAPRGFEQWRDDLTAGAAEGWPRLKATWDASKQAYRDYLSAYFPLAIEQWKATARQAGAR